MRLRRVEVEGYRSIKGPIELHCDPRVTVVLGANDHGKTNLLEALRHLNRDHPFNPASDLNWDFEDQREQLPRVEFEFTIEQPEKDEFEAIFRRKSLAEATTHLREIEAVKLEIMEGSYQSELADINQLTAALEQAEIDKNEQF